MKNSVYIEEMGCDSRALDAGRFAGYFSANGFKVLRSPRRAEYILFITCSFLSSREDYAIRRIRQLQKHKGELIVGGCLKGTNRARLDEVFHGFSFSVQHNEEIEKKFPAFKIRFRDIPDTHRFYRKNLSLCLREYISTVRLNAGYLKRLILSCRRKIFARPYLLRTSWGCIGSHCTYCKVWQAIGALKSKPEEDCVAELERALVQGYRNIFLVGDNVGAWGVDRGKAFPDLLEALLAVPGDYRIHINDLHPRWIVLYADRLIPIFRAGKITYIKTPLQSGNDRILGLMNRGHSAGQFREALAKIREACPGLEICTHIIVGFPSETEEEFEETLKFVREMGASMAYIFPYSGKEQMPETLVRARTRKAEQYFTRHGIAC